VTLLNLTPMTTNPSAPLPDLRASLLLQKVRNRSPLHFSDMVQAVQAGYGCTPSQAAGIIESAKSQGYFKELSGFRLQIIVPHDTLET